MIPKDPCKFKGEFYYHYIEDENGEIPKSYEGLTSHIPLETVVEDEMVKLFGKTSNYKSKCFDLKINNHNYGMWFCISCNNLNENVKNKILWRRSTNKEFLHSLFTNHESKELTLKLEGDAPEVANCPPSTLTLQLVKERRDFHVVSVSLELPLSLYDLFVSRYSE
jgi:hypothetical protein